MPSKRSAGRAAKLARFSNHDDQATESLTLPPVTHYVANKSIREYGGLSSKQREPGTAMIVHASKSKTGSVTEGNQRRAAQVQNLFDALSDGPQEGADSQPSIVSAANQQLITLDTETREACRTLISEEDGGAEPPADEIQQSLLVLSLDDAWQRKPEVPTSEEIMALDQTTVDITPNLIKGPWESAQAYLKTHYELCREDALSPLIDAVAKVREHPNMNDDPTLCIYDKVYFAGVTYSQMGLGMRVTFATTRAQKSILWEYSSRLMAGDLVALSPASEDDRFKRTCIIAIVAARPLEGVKSTPHQVDLYFADPAQADPDPQREYIMVQAKSGYFEAYRSVLTSLQKMATESFHFSKYICSLDTNVQVPQYIRSNPKFDLSELYGPVDEGQEEVDILTDWPAVPPCVDETQWDALHSILTQELAIIQGPPGTGKTHVSVLALKLLLARAEDHDAPIIIAAQTNHALDQLLRHISEFEPNWIRLGSRSKDLEIRKRTVFNLRMKTVLPAVTQGLLGPAYKRRSQLQSDIKELLSVYSARSAQSILPAKLFVKLELMSQQQYDSLIEGNKTWHSEKHKPEDDPLPQWLDKGVKKFEVVYKEETFGFDQDEVDMEYEQLKELEAEQGVDEEFDEELKGDYVALKEGFQARVSKHRKQPPEKYLATKQDLWKIPEDQRGAVYAYLQNRAKSIVRERFRKLYDEYQQTCYRIKLGKFERDEPLLRSAKLIGMTTTGLNKYRALIQALKPRTVLIEEAAEVIEAPVVAACFDSLEHLILVGDHQQLQGHCTVQELAGEPYYLEVSMFERLVKNDMPYRTLLRQRRMAPEIRQIINPIYPDLRDHDVVLNREPVPGMGDCRAFFFGHYWYESADSLSSKYNEGEARMVASFYKYLRANGIHNHDITVLTFYNGQRKKILRSLKENNEMDDGQYHKVVTVDSYQGEENEVIILSLVRHNDAGTIGFLEVANRVCVALSRARRGLYIFGNAECLVDQSNLWKKVITLMGENGALGNELPLVCQTHGNAITVKDPVEMETLEGGCGQPCGQAMPCGHVCPAPCHGVGHERIICPAMCELELECGHVCKLACGQPCRCGEGCPPAWRHDLAVDNGLSHSGNAGKLETAVSNVLSNVSNGRPRAISLGKQPAHQSWQQFTETTREDEKRLEAELQGKMPSSSNNRAASTEPSQDLGQVTGVSIKQLSKHKISQQKRGGKTRFRYESTYTVERTSPIKPDSTTGEPLLVNAPPSAAAAAAVVATTPEAEVSGAVTGIAAVRESDNSEAAASGQGTQEAKQDDQAPSQTTDVVMGDLIEL